MADAWIVDVVRTPRGKGRADGALHDVHPQELLAQCLRALATRVGFDPAEVDDVIAGNGILTGDHDAVGRLATLLAGWPRDRAGHDAQPLLRIRAAGDHRRGDGRGERATRTWSSPAASSRCRAGTSRPARSPSTAATPTSAPASRPCRRASRPTSSPRSKASAAPTSTRSRSRASAAPRSRSTEGRFDRGIVAVTGADGEVLLARDEHPRPGTTLEGLAKLRPAFAEMGATYDEMALAALSRRRPHRPRPPRRATPRVSSTARPRPSWRRRRGSTPTGSRHARASARPPPSARSR